MATRKKKLDDDDFEFDDFRLLGISASGNDFTLCFHLNELLQADFQRIDDHKWYSKIQEKEVPFRVFEWYDEAADFSVQLFNNKNGAEALISEIASIDYILKIAGKKSAAEISQALRSIPDVLSVFDLPLIKLRKSLQNIEYNPSQENK